MAEITTVDVLDLEATCRICLLPQDSINLWTLFGSNTENHTTSENLSLAGAILDCFGIDVKQDQELPSNVCIKCALTIMECYRFKNRLVKCQGLLQERKEQAKQKVNEENQEDPSQESQEVFYYYLLDSESEDSENEQSNVSGDASNDTCNDVELCSTSDVGVSAFTDHDYCGTTMITDDQDVTIITDEQDVTIITDEQDVKCVTDNETKIDDGNISDELQRIDSTTKTVENHQYKYEKSNVFPDDSSDKWWLRESGPPYQCGVCSRSYGVRFRAFYTHARSHFLEKISCDYCGKKVSRDKMICHVRTHTREKPFVCEQCPASFSVEGNLKRHLRCHTGERLYVCDVCGKTFTQVNNLNDHKQRHEEQSMFICEYCGKTFKTDAHCRSHISHCHKTKTPVEECGDHNKKYTCQICSKVFRKAGRLQIHARLHKEGKKPWCSECRRSYTSYVSYEIHWLVRHQEESPAEGPRNWLCKFCDQTFLAKSILVRHIRGHVVRPFACAVCDKQFVSKTALAMHSRYHTAARHFACNVCGKSFLSNPVLRLHMRVHTGEKPFKCETCGRSFTQQQQLLSHMYTHTGEKPHVCPYCGKAFALNGNLTVHKRRHTGETPFICDLCERGFYDSSNLKKHKLAQHKEAFRDKA